MGLVWICAEKRVDSTETFSFLLSRTYLVSRHLTTPHQGGDSEYTRSWGSTQPGQLTLIDQKDIPGHMASCSAYKARGGRRKRETLRMTVFIFPGHSYMWWSLAFLEVAEHLPPHGKWQMCSLFCFFICMAFILSIKLPLTQPTSFFTFMLLILSPIPPGVIEHVVWCLVINWG